MESGNLDVTALVRAVLVGLGVGGGLVVSAIAYFVTRKRADWGKKLPVIIMGGVGMAIIVGGITYLTWPSLISVRSLDGLSQAEAEDVLRGDGLEPKPRPQHAPNTDAGRVIPHSQNPSAGLSVRRGTVVTFAVGERSETPSNGSSPGLDLSISIFKPRSGEKIFCEPGANGLYTVSAQGSSSGVSPGSYGLLLWLKPVKPPANPSGWFLQRPPDNGITEFRPDGSWSGIAQVGDARYPPQEGHTVDLAVTIAEKTVIDQLMAESGVVVRNQPVGLKSATASPVTLTLK